MAVEPSFFVRFGLFEKGWTGFEFQVFGSKRGGRIKFHQHLLGVRKKKQLQSHHGSYSEKGCENDQVLFKTVTYDS